MKYTYDALVDFWNACKDEEPLKVPQVSLMLQAKQLEPNLWVQKLSGELFCLSWRSDDGPAHTWVYVHKDGTFQCVGSSSRTRRSERYLQKLFGSDFKFAAAYPEVLGIQGWVENLLCVWVDLTGRPVQTPKFWSAPFSYEQLTAALACQILHYCRVNGHEQPKLVYLWRTRKSIKIWPCRYRALAAALKDLFAETDVLSSLEIGEQLCWKLPDLRPIEAELKQLAGDLGHPSTRHLSTRRANIDLPSLDSIDFSTFPRCFPKRLGNALITQVSGDKVQILNRSTKVLLAEVGKDRSLVLWDVSSAYARNVHSQLETKLKVFDYMQRRVCYLQLPNLSLYGPAFDGCRLVKGVCTNPLKLWSGDLSLEDLGLQLRRFLVDWFVENLAKLSPLKLMLEITFSSDRAQVLCTNLLWLPEEAKPQLMALPDLVGAWHAEQLRFRLSNTLVAHFSCQAWSAHEALALLES